MDCRLFLSYLFIPVVDHFSVGPAGCAVANVICYCYTLMKAANPESLCNEQQNVHLNSVSDQSLCV